MFAASFDEIGYRYVEDMNAPEAWDGIYGQWPLNRKNAVRQGTLVTYVREARERPNFTIRGHCLTDRVLIESGRASGVRYIDADGQPQQVGADLVLLAGGAYGSPLRTHALGHRARGRAPERSASSPSPTCRSAAT